MTDPQDSAQTTIDRIVEENSGLLDRLRDA